MAEVTALRTVPHRPSRVEVFLDGRLWRVIPAAAAAGLSVGMSLDARSQESLKARAGEAAALERVGRLLAVRPRTTAEVRRRLERAGFPPSTIEAVIARLQEAGDLDDRAFTRVWIENRMTFRPRGAAMLRAELRRKGVASTSIEEALHDVDDEEAAWAAARRAAGRWPGLDDFARRQRLYAYLQRRGFDSETIRLVLNRLQLHDEEREEPA